MGSVLHVRRIVDIPFPTARLASVALQAIEVDQELSALVRRTMSVVSLVAGEESESKGESEAETVMRVHYEATTNRMLRVAVNTFMDSLRLVLEVMEVLDVDVLRAAAPEDQKPLEPWPHR